VLSTLKECAHDGGNDDLDGIWDDIYSKYYTVTLLNQKEEQETAYNRFFNSYQPLPLFPHRGRPPTSLSSFLAIPIIEGSKVSDQNSENTKVTSPT
jgi:hypothetical protein